MPTPGGATLSSGVVGTRRLADIAMPGTTFGDTRWLVLDACVAARRGCDAGADADASADRTGAAPTALVTNENYLWVDCFAVCWRPR